MAIYQAVEGAGEMNFAPTNIAHAFEDEAVDGGGRNEFRPYKDGGNH
jgi:hypothetical protein